jgi:hypothetical protein
VPVKLLTKMSESTTDYNRLSFVVEFWCRRVLVPSSSGAVELGVVELGVVGLSEVWEAPFGEFPLGMLPLGEGFSDPGLFDK